MSTINTNESPRRTLKKLIYRAMVQVKYNGPDLIIDNIIEECITVAKYPGNLLRLFSDDGVAGIAIRKERYGVIKKLLAVSEKHSPGGPDNDVMLDLLLTYDGMWEKYQAYTLSLSLLQHTNNK